MTKRLIEIQSISDIITNSSSEVFIISSDFEDKQALSDDIYEMLKVMLEAAGEVINGCLTVSVEERAYVDTYWNYPISKGDIVIHSAGENSIPPFLMGFLEYDIQWHCPRLEGKITNVEHRHLG